MMTSKTAMTIISERPTTKTYTARDILFRSLILELLRATIE
jgi:hypothetical protein